MFEDSTFESTGRIRTRSRGWMIAAFLFNGSILLTLILIPLIYPEALSRQAVAFLMEAPLQPAPQPKPQTPPANATVIHSEIEDGRIFAPPSIPIRIATPTGPEVLPNINVVGLGQETGGPGGDNPFRGQTALPIVHSAPNHPMRVSGSVVEGLLIEKSIPRYPTIAIAARIEGTVVLQATISKTGTIENLRAVSGPAMLQQAALDAVKTWRYRPYLLSGDPVEVETTVNVVFNLGP